ncbi:MAG: tail fiber domain-containing protein [Rhodanobacteraceae bacterium]
MAIAVPLASAHAATLTYHGTLQDAGKPAEGKYDIELTLYSAQSGGSAVAGPLTLYGVQVREGSFSTEADFGSRSDGLSNAWVGVQVRAAGSSDFTALDKRSPASIDAATGTCSSWALDGNAGNPAGSYLGTADNQSLFFKVNGGTLGYLDTNNHSVSFGEQSSASGMGSFSGGSMANATGAYSVSLGLQNTASGQRSFAAGNNAIAATDRSFVWSDGAANGQFTSINPNQFLIHATGGVGINTTDTTQSALTAESDTLNGIKGSTISSTVNGIAGYQLNTNTDVNFHPAGVYGVAAGVHAVGVYAQNFGGGTALLVDSSNASSSTKPIFSTTGAYLSNAGVWTNASDRNLKSGFSAIDARKVLEKVVALPVTNWFYKSEGASVRHIGPVAQDFKAAFGLGRSDKAIGTVDEGGVALAAIQGLNKKIEEENSALKAQNAALVAKLDQLADRVTKFEVAQGAARAAKFEVAQQGE